MPESKQPLALPVSGPFSALHNVMTSAQNIPPQVLLTYNGNKKAYGREKLKDLGFNASIRRHYASCAMLLRTFVSQALAKIFRVDFGATPAGPRGSDRILYATFYRTHGHDDGGDRVPFNEDSWEELIGNIAKIELVDPFRLNQVSLLM